MQKLSLVLTTLLALSLPAPAQAAAPQVSINSQSDEEKHITAQVVIDAPASFVWQTITDYNALKTILPGYQKSQIMQNSGANKVVAFALKVAPILPAYAYNVKVTENAAKYFLNVQRVSGDFDAIQASYQLTPTAGGTQTVLTYKMNIDLGAKVPKIGVNSMLQSSTQKSLAALQSHCVKVHRKSVVAQR